MPGLCAFPQKLFFYCPTVEPNPLPEGFAYTPTLARVRALVERLQGGQVPFEESLALFEEGTALLRQCQAYLDAGELTVRQATLRQDGGVDESSFE